MPTLIHVLTCAMAVVTASPEQTSTRPPVSTTGSTPEVDGSTDEGWPTAAWVLQLLGGIEGGYLWGSAEITAGITTDGGASGDIASGSVSLDGFHISLYDGGGDSGFGVKPLLGFFQHRIQVADFARDVPQPETDVGTDIDAICSFAVDGLPVPCGTPNTYGLTVTDLYTGVWGGYQASHPWRRLRFVFNVGLALPLLEYRSVDLTIGSSGKGSAKEVVLLRSWGVGGSAGVHVPAWHAALRLHIYQDGFGNFGLDQPAEFLGGITCDEDTGRCSRERAWVESFTLSVTRFQVTAAWVF